MEGVVGKSSHGIVGGVVGSLVVGVAFLVLWVVWGSVVDLL